jgi:protein SCO1
MMRKAQILDCGLAIVGALLVAGLSAVGAQTYSGAGVVLQVRPERSEIVLSMKEIPGFMDAMVMRLPVRRRRDLEGLRLGMLVDFDLVVSDRSSYAEDIRIHPFANLENDPQGAERIAVLERALAENPSADPMLDVGQHVPDFSLNDQTGQSVSLSQFSGKVIAMTFVYTRCALPNFCFRLSNNFGQLQKRFGKQMGRDLILLTVTLDPTYDHPGALAKYGSIWKADAASWHFLTGPATAIRNVTGMFGVAYTPDEGFVTHSLHTVVIDRRGNLVANLEGNEFTAQQLGDLVETVLNRGPDSPGTERANFH